MFKKNYLQILDCTRKYDLKLGILDILYTYLSKLTYSMNI